jgi:hypothetical protein
MLDPWYFNNNGLKINYYDLSPMFFSNNKIKESLEISKNNLNIPNYKIINNYEEFQREIDSQPNNSSVWLSGRNPFKNYDDSWLLKLLTKKTFPIYPFAFENPINTNYIKNNKKYFRLKKSRFQSRKYSILGYISCGSLGRYCSKIVYPNSDYISVPTPLVKWINYNNNIDHKYYVFVDENVGYSLDSNLLNLNGCNDVVGYYKRLNKMFNNIEMWTGIPVIIACSGKVKYSKNNFDNRKLIYGHTKDLIHFSEAVLGHYSTALYQAIVSYKPLYLFSDDSFINHRKKHIVNFSKYFLSKNLFFLDKFSNKELFENNEVDKDRYNSLIHLYLKENNVTNSYYKIMLDYFTNQKE